MQSKVSGFSKSTLVVISLAIAMTFGSCRDADNLPVELEALPVSSVHFEITGKGVDQEKLMEHIQLKPGGVFSAEAMERDVNNLYQSGYVQDVKVIASLQNAQVDIIYKVVIHGTNTEESRGVR